MEALRERFGKYHVLEKLAQGGMAEVYKVKTVGIAGFEKVQALKRILPRQAREAKFIRSFIDEARIAVELTHRNIVQVFDFGKADGELFLAMELIEGKDLRTVMLEAESRHEPPPVPITAYIISEIASGLEYAHRKADGYGGSLGIVHCDVSPANVMLSTEGDVKILDFGIARATFASALELRRRLRGKPRYMAPEQTIGEPPTAASDVFALGIIAWELFTGRPLYHGPGLKDILEAVRRTVPPRIDRGNPNVPIEIVEAVATALTRDPARRGTAGDLVTACAGAALRIGPRAVAKWLALLQSQPSRAVTPWQPVVTSIDVPADGAPGALEDALAAAEAPRWPRSAAPAVTLPPPRPPETVSLDDAPNEPASRPASGAVGSSPAHPTPWMHREGWAAARSAWADVEVDTERPGRPGRPEQTDRTEIDVGDLTALSSMTPAPQRFEPEASTTQIQRYDTVAAGASMEATTTAHVPRPSAPGRWHDRWSDRGQREAGANEAPTGAEAAVTVTDPTRFAHWTPATEANAAATERFVRQPSEVPAAEGSAPVALFHDHATHRGFAPPPRMERPRESLRARPDAREPSVAGAEDVRDPDATSYDDLDPDALDRALGGSDPAGAAIGDAPIDDDLGVIATRALAERRRLVIVVAVLAGATPDALRPVTKSLGELAYQRGGVVLEIARDSLVVAFGLEIAGEDDVAVAMGWALDAAAMARDTATDGDTVQVRIGARAGVATASPPGSTSGSSSSSTARRGPALVTVARAPDSGLRIPDDAIEDARALALEAAPDRPLFVGGAGRLTSSLYSLRERPDGRRSSRRGQVIEVIGPRGFQERDRARLERRGTFVGRSAQLAELELWLSRAVAADRRLSVLITGPAGIGKSRLIAELIARRAAAGAPLRVTTCAVSPANRLAPFATVIDLYQAALGMPPSRGRTARAEVVHRVHGVLTHAGVPAERARAVTIDLDRAMELRDGLAVGTRESADLRPRISAGLAVFQMAKTSRERTVLTVVEDVHMADSASLEVLRHSLAMPVRGPELLVLTARPEGPALPPVDAVLTLGDLVGSDLRTLIVHRLGDAATPMAIATVLARGGGNPLFVEELAQAVRDAGPAGEDVPVSARDVVSARIDRLSPKARTALRFASVLGGAVRVRLIEELLGEDSLDRELDEVVAAGFLVRPDGAGGGADGELSFARGLVREIVYESLSARAQRETHARVGRLLASRFFAGREEPPAQIAEHLERGGEIAGAAAFWLRAGRLALSASDAGAAIACFTRTLGLERELGATPPTPTSKARRREALAGREEAHRLQGDLAADPGDLDELAQLCAGEPARLADVAIRRAQRLLRLGDYASASDATGIAEVHATTAGDDRLRGEALRVRGEILERVGRFDEALEVVGAARELFHRQHAVADEMAAMVGRGRILLLRAHYEAARDAYRPVLALIEQTGDPWLERLVKNHVAVIEMCLGNFTAAMRCALRSLELCRRYGDRGREGDAQSVAGIVLLEVGLYDPAATLFAGALDILSRTNSRWSRADCLIYAGLCEQRRGRTGGLAMLDEALTEARRLGARYLEANALVARAGAYLRMGALSAAVADASEGTAVAREATLVGYEIQGLSRHALALSRIGNRTSEAAELARRAVALLDEQKYLEGSEEDVLVACAAVLRAAGDRASATLLRERGRSSARRKLAQLQDPTWRSAYAALPEIADLLASGAAE